MDLNPATDPSRRSSQSSDTGRTPANAEPWSDALPATAAEDDAAELAEREGGTVATWADVAGWDDGEDDEMEIGDEIDEEMRRRGVAF